MNQVGDHATLSVGAVPPHSFDSEMVRGAEAQRHMLKKMGTPGLLPPQSVMSYSGESLRGIVEKPG